MNIEVSISDTPGDTLELLVQGDSALEHRDIDNAFEDGLRNHARECYVEAQRTIRKSDDGVFVVTCKPFYSDNMDRVHNTIRYELQFHLRYPLKTSR